MWLWVAIVGCGGGSTSSPSATGDTAAAASTAEVTGHTGPSGSPTTDTADPSVSDDCVGAITDWGKLELEPTGSSRQFDVAHASDGQAIWLTWTEDLPYIGGGAKGGGYVVMTGRLGCDGTWTHGPVPVSADPVDSNSNGSVAAGPEGALFVWSGSEGGAYFRVDVVKRMAVAPDGVVVSPPAPLALTLAGAPYGGTSANPRAAVLPMGGYAVVGEWAESGVGDQQIFAVVTDAAGAPLGDAATVWPETGAPSRADVAATEPLTVGWHHAGRPEAVIATQDPAGVTLERIPSVRYDVAAASEGPWVAWQVTNNNPSFAVRAPSGLETWVGSSRLDREPSIAVGEDKVAVLWATGGPFEDERLKLASFDRQGNLLGEQDLLAEGGTGDKLDVSHVGSDVFFVAWAEPSPSVSHPRMFGQFVDLR